MLTMGIGYLLVAAQFLRVRVIRWVIVHCPVHYPAFYLLSSIHRVCESVTPSNQGAKSYRPFAG